MLRGARSRALPALRRQLDTLGIPVEEVDRDRLDRLCGGGRHQGVVVRAVGSGEMGLTDFEQLALSRGRSFCCLVLDSVQDPRNLGACLRRRRCSGCRRGRDTQAQGCKPDSGGAQGGKRRCGNGTACARCKPGGNASLVAPRRWCGSRGQTQEPPRRFTRRGSSFRWRSWSAVKARV